MVHEWKETNGIEWKVQNYSQVYMKIKYTTKEASQITGTKINFLKINVAEITE